MDETGAKITFFMPVTDRDAVIADYSIPSYGKIKGIPFRLRVYSNWLSAANRKHYFPRWKRHPFVDLLENEWQREKERPRGKGLEGPFFKGAYIWDTELKKIDTPYHATVDADFEVLNGRFVNEMLDALDADPKLIAMSAEYSPVKEPYYDIHTDDIIRLNERWHTWFCIYKREALASPVSHALREEVDPTQPVPRGIWDDAGYLQKTLREEGYRLAALDHRFRGDFIHYGAFSRNRHITRANVALYRRIRIFRKNGIFGVKTRLLKRIAKRLEQVCFGHVDRTHFFPG
jgi:hypothetical protein